MKQSTFDKLLPLVSEDNQFIDQTMIMAWWSAILSIWKSCGADTAKSRAKEGGPVAFGQALRIVWSHSDLRGRQARKKAAELVALGQTATDEDFEEIANDSKDVPTFVPTGIFQLAALILVLFCSSASAQSGIFQVDVEQNYRLDILEKKVDEFETFYRSIGGGSIPACPSCPANTSLLGSKVVLPSIAAALQSAPAYEIHNGVRVHTSNAHLIHHGYSPSQFADLTPDQKDRLHGAAHNGNFSGATTTTASSYIATNQKYPQVIAKVSTGYVDLCNGRNCRRIRRNW